MKSHDPVVPATKVPQGCYNSWVNKYQCTAGRILLQHVHPKIQKEKINGST